MRIHPTVIAVCIAIAGAVSAAPQSSAGALPPGAEQVAKIIGVDQLMSAPIPSAAVQNRPQTPIPEELLRRQQITEAILAASLDVDSVLGEISNEHACLTELRSVLEARRDRAVNLANALQFKDSTAILGDAIGVGSGVAATVLSVIGLHVQNGPQRGVQRSPNMLAVLFGCEPVLQSQYPQTALDYLKSVPPGQPSSSGTRLEQLQREWYRVGRLGKPGTPGSEKKN